MKRLVLAAGILLAFATPSIAQASAAPHHVLLARGPETEDAIGKIVTLPAGTAVPVHVVGVVSSANMKSGDTFQFQTATDIVVNGMIAIRAGSLGSGTILAVEHAGGNGHSGALTVNFDWVYAADGGKIKLAPAAQTQAEEDRKGASSTATIIGFATFGLGGLFGHNLAHGRELTVDNQKVLNAFVADSVHVRVVERAIADHYDR